MNEKRTTKMKEVVTVKNIVGTLLLFVASLAPLKALAQDDCANSLRPSLGDSFNVESFRSGVLGDDGLQHAHGYFYQNPEQPIDEVAFYCTLGYEAPGSGEVCESGHVWPRSSLQVIDGHRLCIHKPASITSAEAKKVAERLNELQFMIWGDGGTRLFCKEAHGELFRLPTDAEYQQFYGAMKPGYLVFEGEISYRSSLASATGEFCD